MAWGVNLAPTASSLAKLLVIGVVHSCFTTSAKSVSRLCQAETEDSHKHRKALLTRWSRVVPLGDKSADFKEEHGEKAARLAEEDVQTAARPLTRVVLSRVDALAVCNDGSPASYFWRPASPGGERIWLVFLHGGYGCHGDKDCSNSGSRQTSSNEYPASLQLGGLFSPQSPLYTANVAFVPYCSSDAHVGDAGADENAAKVHFRGARIVRAVFSDLASGPTGISPGDLVVVGGQSAGARGAMLHIDSMAVRSGGALPAGIKMVGLFDSGFWVDQAEILVPGQGVVQNLTNHTRTLLSVAAASSFVAPPECRQLLGSDWKCFFSAHRLPLLQAPFLLLAPQSDTFQLRMAGGPAGLNQDQAEALAAAVRRSMKGLIRDRPKTAGVFSTGCKSYSGVLDDSFFHPSGKHTQSGAEALRCMLRNVTAQSKGVDGCPMPSFIEPCGSDSLAS